MRCCVRANERFRTAFPPFDTRATTCIYLRSVRYTHTTHIHIHIHIHTYVPICICLASHRICTTLDALPSLPGPRCTTANTQSPGLV